MKKLLSCLIVLVMGLGGSVAVLAEQQQHEVYKSGDYKYIILADGTVEITGCLGFAEELIIPDMIDGQKVTSIGERAFATVSYKRIIISDGILSIGNNAFDSCKNLSEITMPDSLVHIGEGAFNNCKLLTSVMIPDSVSSITGNPFTYCSSLTDIIVSPDHLSLEVVDGVLFNKLDKRLIFYPISMTENSYVIPEGTEIVGKNAFTSQKCLKSIVIPDSVKIIEDYAFAYCDNLASIKMPDTLDSLGNRVFNSCRSLSDISIPEGLTSIGEFSFAFCESLKSVSIPSSVTSIGTGSFLDCTSLSGIMIHDNVDSIADDAFENCVSLTIYTVPDSYVMKYCQDHGIEYSFDNFDVAVLPEDDVKFIFDGKLSWDSSYNDVIDAFGTPLSEELYENGGFRAIYYGYEFCGLTDLYLGFYSYNGSITLITLIKDFEGDQVLLKEILKEVVDTLSVLYGEPHVAFMKGNERSYSWSSYEMGTCTCYPSDGMLVIQYDSTVFGN